MQDIASVRAWVDKTVGEFEKSHHLPAIFQSAYEHSVLSGGKRIRPVFFLSLLSDLGGSLTAGREVAVAIECLHCASLIHDDLPALDNDDYRRGRPSCHKVIGEGPALLFGDLLPVLALEAVSAAPLAPDVRCKLISQLTRAYAEVCVGQVLDLSSIERSRNLFDVYRRKTGALFAACAAAALILMERSADQIGLAHAFGESLGISFQIIDDYIDLYGSDEARGRHGSSDTRNERENFFTRYGKEDGHRELLSYIEEVRKKLRSLEEVVAASGAGGLQATQSCVEQLWSRLSTC